LLSCPTCSTICGQLTLPIAQFPTTDGYTRFATHDYSSWTTWAHTAPPLGRKRSYIRYLTTVTMPVCRLSSPQLTTQKSTNGSSRVSSTADVVPASGSMPPAIEGPRHVPVSEQPPASGDIPNNGRPHRQRRRLSARPGRIPGHPHHLRT